MLADTYIIKAASGFVKCLSYDNGEGEQKMKSDVKKIVGGDYLTLVERRKQAGLRQEDLAKKLRVHQTTISSWEVGVRRPKRKNLKKIAKFYGCTVDELLTNEPSEN